jgi:hypothetical protein
MIATFAIEVALLAYVIIRYKMNSLARIVSATLILLATFQFAEFHVCESIGTSSFYSRLGFIAITFLPPVGIHLVNKIAGRPAKAWIAGAYASGTAMALGFGLSMASFTSYECAGNYAVFQLADNVGGIFFGYYYFWMLAGIIMCLKYSLDAAKNTRRALIYQTFGYLSFILPTGIVNALNPTTISGIPSIMCGFAVLYALVLTFGIAPVILKRIPLPAILSRN